MTDEAPDADRVEVDEDYLAELARREWAGERHQVSIGPYSAMMMHSAMQWTVTTATDLGRQEDRALMFAPAMTELRRLFVEVDDHQALAILDREWPPPAT